MKKDVTKEYSLVSDVECNVRRFMEGGKWGLLNEQNRVILTTHYDYIYTFEKGYAQVKKNELYGIIDTYGTEIVEPIYHHVFDFDGDLAIVYNGKFWGAINKKGSKIIPTIYEKEFHFWGKEYAIIKCKYGYNIINRKGMYMLEKMFNEITCENGRYLTKEEGKIKYFKL